jgi:ATP-dependent DNA helicase PIF1
MSLDTQLPEATCVLSTTQQRVIDLVEQGKNVLILGSAGCGKSTVIKQIKQANEGSSVYITSTTGISAYNIQGITLHSFMGFGTGDGTLDTLHSRMTRRKGCIQRIVNTNVLIIDEISMMSAELFEKLDALLKIIRKNTSPFGEIYSNYFQ